MEKIIIAFYLITFALGGFAQQQIENGDFEAWENQGTAEEEPVDWSSLKTADALASTAPSVLSPDTGRNGGTCARLEVKEVPLVGIKANGLLTNGRVHADFNPENGYVFTDPNDPQWHTAFTSRPDSIIGWYKYEPQNGDKGKIEVVLHVSQGSLPFNGTENNMIGRAKFEFTTQQTSWTRFSKEFNYYDPQAPEYILTTIASGDSTISETGSTLWIDDISLVYNTSNIDENNTELTSINASSGELRFFNSNGLSDQNYTVTNIAGQLIQQGECKENVLFTQPSGLYLITITDGLNQFTKKVYVH
tara:strand:- start:96359 stop:97273 length:915 start_codon:yes stop_codon:yes gene_type:complete